MGIDDESEVSANLQIGPTTLGMVRLFIETETLELPLDFDPDEAEEIAEELRAAAAKAREAQGSKSKRSAAEASGKARHAERDGRGGRPPQGPPKRRRGSGSSR